MNTSGIHPIEFNILVKQDEVAAQTKGGLHIPLEMLDREKHGQTRGVIVAVSPMAFNEDIFPEGLDRPKPGDRVAWARHAGTFVEGMDEQEYRVVKDKDVVALIEVQNG